jgi:hypothetical protein
MPSEQDVTRRYLLQTGAAALATGLAGCSGGNNSDGSDETDEENSSDVDTTPEETTEPEPDYSLPESEHANPVDMATEWMIFPDDQGDALQAVALSPSALDEQYDKSFAEDIAADENYDMFEFSARDIPETFIQVADDPWESRIKVDQLPNNVSQTSLGYQLKDEGYEFQEERGDFKIYSDGNVPHAVSEDRHVVILRTSGASSSEAADLMERALEETNENTYELSNVMEEGLENINVQDSVTIQKLPSDFYMPSTGTSSHQPSVAMSSVDFETGEKYGAWPFEDSDSAQSALALLEAAEEVRDGYEDLEINDRTVVGYGGNYNIGEMNSSGWVRMSNPRI